MDFTKKLGFMKEKYTSQFQIENKNDVILSIANAVNKIIEKLGEKKGSPPQDLNHSLSQLHPQRYHIVLPS